MVICGLDNLNRSKAVADVVELVRRVPLDKRFAAKLQKELRGVFKKIVDAVRAGDSRGGPSF